MPIKVLVVDDSLFMRSLVSDLLNSAHGIRVAGTAKDGPEALRKIPLTHPDCITLDLAMPGWAGLTTLKHIMAKHPTPVVILSAHSKENADITMECLHAGAVSFLLKPSGELSLDIAKIKDQLIEQVEVAAQIKVQTMAAAPAARVRIHARETRALKGIVVIGSSTGGPQTLETILPSLPADFPVPILIAQHMPTAAFSESLASRLNKRCPLLVKLAGHGEVIQPGVIYVAPGGFHMTVDKAGETRIVIRLSKCDSDTLSPQVDTLMKSAAKVYGESAIGVVLTGMGDDGVKGARAIKEAGGRIIVQDASSLIFGMPRAVMDAGLADNVVSQLEMTEAMTDVVAQSAWPMERL